MCDPRDFRNFTIAELRHKTKMVEAKMADDLRKKAQEEGRHADAPLHCRQEEHRRGWRTSYQKALAERNKR